MLTDNILTQGEVKSHCWLMSCELQLIIPVIVPVPDKQFPDSPARLPVALLYFHVFPLGSPHVQIVALFWKKFSMQQGGPPLQVTLLSSWMYPVDLSNENNWDGVLERQFARLTGVRSVAPASSRQSVLFIRKVMRL